MSTPTKFQIPSFKFQGNAINYDKGEKRKENQNLFCFYWNLTIPWNLDFGTWNLFGCGRADDKKAEAVLPVPRPLNP